jgi:hypothetical protein
MLDFLTHNLGTILVGFILAGIVAAIIFRLMKKKKQEKCIGCNCACGGCNKGN